MSSTSGSGSASKTGASLSTACCSWPSRRRHGPSRASRPGDVVATTYDDLPIRFYAGLRAVGGLTGEGLAPARSAEWVIIRRNLVSDQSAAVY